MPIRTTISQSLRRPRKLLGARVCDPQQLGLQPRTPHKTDASFAFGVLRLTEPRSGRSGWWEAALQHVLTGLSAEPPRRRPSQEGNPDLQAALIGIGTPQLSLALPIR